MLKQLLVCYIAIQITIQACTTGCLKCSATNECQLCDNSKFYSLNTATKACTKISIDNCVTMNATGECITCGSSYYLNALKCTVVDTAKQTATPNCAVWSTSQSCSGCQQNFILETNKCVAVNTPIANCQKHQSQSACLICKSGYELNTLKTECAALPSISNCWTYGDYSCNSCKTDFYLNPNYYLSFYTKTANVESILGSNLDTNRRVLNAGVCQAVTDTNCVTHTAHNACSVCSGGYYLLQNKTCQINPKTILTNCEIYTSNTKCTKCAPNFYPNTGGKCVAVSAVVNCDEYQRETLNGVTTNNGKCTRCTSDYFVSNNTCVERSKKNIEGCAKLNSFQDSCETCSNGKVGNPVNSNYTSCVTEVANCQANSYTISAQGGTPTASCTKCNEQYFRIASSDQQGATSNCEKGNDDKNCQNFSQTTNVTQDNAVCQECKNGYYLVGNTCTAHEQTTVTNCNRWSNIAKNQCEVCDAGFFAVKIVKDCTQNFTLIPNCVTYQAVADDVKTNVKCATCETGFYKNATDTCTAIPATKSQCMNVSTDGQDCLKCNTGYGLATNFTTNTTIACKTANASVLSVCSSSGKVTSNQDWASMACDVCNESSYPFNLADHAVCVERSLLPNLKEFPTPANNAASDNCAVYDNVTDATPAKCIQCNNGFALNGAVCLNLSTNSCPTGLSLFSWNNTKKRSSKKVCNSAGSAAIQYYAPDTLGTATQIAVKCLISNTGNDITLIAPAVSKGSNVNFQNQSESHFAMIMPEISCLTYVTATHSIGSSNTDQLVSNCKYYAVDTTVATRYFCVVCNGGATGNGTDGSLSCQANLNCDNNAKNVPLYWQARVSCTVCTGSVGQVPYIVMNDIANPASWFTSVDFSNQDWSSTTTKNNLQGCVDGSVTGLQSVVKFATNLVQKTTAVYTNAEVPAFCGLYVVNPTAKADSTQIAAGKIKCAYCKMGYKPTFSGNYVTKCEVINDCATGMINGCETCSEGFGFKLDTNSKLDTTACKKMGTNSVTVPSNCLVHNDTICTICKKTYTLTLDGTCQKLSGLICQDGQFSINNALLTNTANASATENHSLRQYLTPGIQGCSQCSDSSGQAALWLDRAPGVNALQKTFCIQSDFSHAATFPANSQYISNCKNYDADNTGDLKCSICQSNYVLTSNRDQCVLSSVAANCLTFDNNPTTNGCLICKTGFGIVKSSTNKKTCLANNITQCKTVDSQNNTTTTVKCTVCNMNYYLDTATNKCNLGNVRNCNILQGANTCTTCHPDYVRVPTVSGKILNSANSTTSRDYCLKIPPSIGCTDLTLAKSGGSQISLECNSCTTIQNRPLAVVTNDAQNPKADNLCSPFSQIANCTTYNVDVADRGNNFAIGKIQGVQNSNFSCWQCNAGFFVEGLGYNCKARVATKDNAQCAAYILNEDKCKVCNDGYFLDTQKIDCVIFPSGETGCTSWKTTSDNKRVCASCDTTSYYLEGTNCVHAPLADANCAVVNSLTSCSKCKPNYSLESGAPTTTGSTLTNHCKQSSVTNCAVYASNDSCLECNDKYKIQTNQSTNKSTCLSITVSGCASVGGYTKDKCTTCANQKYLVQNSVNNECKSANAIVKCSKWSSQTDCSMCDSGFVLTTDKKACNAVVSSWDSNCSYQNTPASRPCSRCNAGYEFKDGNCVSLTGKQSASNGCLAALTDSTDCLICTTGYHMNSSTSCINDNPVTPPPTTTGVRIVTALASLLAMILLF